MRVQLLDEATTDLADGYHFYERQSEGLGEGKELPGRCSVTINSTVDLLGQYAKLGLRVSRVLFVEGFWSDICSVGPCDG